MMLQPKCPSRTKLDNFLLLSGDCCLKETCPGRTITGLRLAGKLCPGRTISGWRWELCPCRTINGGMLILCPSRTKSSSETTSITFLTFFL